MNIYEFMSQHWFLTWCLAWPASFLALVVICMPFKIINRILRTIKVLARGWPPEHIDADGDWKTEQNDEDES